MSNPGIGLPSEWWKNMFKLVDEEESKVLKQKQKEAVEAPVEAPDLMPEDLSYLKNFFIDVLHTGSRVICNPPVTDTDDDWVVLCKDKEQVSQMETFLAQSGFQKGGSEGFPDEKPEGGFHSWKKPFKAGWKEPFKEGWDEDETVLNVILTDSPEFFDKSQKATWLSKRLNLLEKEHRILVFRAIREGLFTELPKEAGKRYKKFMFTSPTTAGSNLIPNVPMENGWIVMQEARDIQGPWVGVNANPVMVPH